MRATFRRCYLTTTVPRMLAGCTVQTYLTVPRRLNVRE